MGSFTFWAVIMWHNGNATAHTNITKHNTAQHSAEGFSFQFMHSKENESQQILIDTPPSTDLMQKKAKTKEKKIENTAII